MNYPSVGDIIIDVIDKLIETCGVDIDELVYDQISNYDEHFEDDSEWFDEEESDMKDSLRDQVLSIIARSNDWKRSCMR